MGEEAKQEQPEAEVKPAAEEKKEEEEPKPPSPCVLFVDLHCVGCAKKIHRSILKIRGVEGVVIDMAKNEVTIKGIVDPQAICNIITKRIKRSAKIISPLPQAEGESIPEVVTSQVSAPITVELNVNMHCEACAEQLKRKILKMRGVQKAETEFSTGKVTVMGTMDGEKLVDYVYRRTKKQAKIVPQAAEPEADKENNKEEKGGGEEEAVVDDIVMNDNNVEDEGLKRMMYHYYQPLYVVERIPPPQLFSDENPNACCIS
ncbi:heavy metal-associated isoprenylated plant protein 9 [Senna tora]|uniref:Heavy metal-associated isoprenylated plant protein 9 n=1 Tax=Senna tora TaxID=362788 RepID=A0A834WQC7_9FABA|nr:heavy metal-associated isoprenylated plant protein 9 [Senna tora]